MVRRGNLHIPVNILGADRGIPVHVRTGKAQPGRRDPQQALVGLYQVIGIEQGVEHTDSGIFVGNLLCLVGNIGAFVVTQRDKKDIVIGTVVGRFRFVVRLAAQQLDPDGVGPVGADQLQGLLFAPQETGRVLERPVRLGPAVDAFVILFIVADLDVRVCVIVRSVYLQFRHFISGELQCGRLF